MTSSPPNELLRLTPRDNSTPVLLVSRSRFRLGRSPTHADWVSQFLPANPENERLTNELGRVHVLGEIVDGRPALRDGNGLEASINESAFDGRPLDAHLPTPVVQPGLLMLGDHYALDVHPLLAPFDDALAARLAERFGSAMGASRGASGAVVFAPRSLQPRVRDAVWLFTHIDFTLRPNGGPAWLPPRPGNPATLLHAAGAFHILNASFAEGALRLDGRNIPAGEIVPLGNRQTLQLGPRSYAVEIE